MLKLIPGFAAAVQMAMCQPAACAGVEAIYQKLGDAVKARQPVCVASGRCCKFEEFGHRLFVTTLEMAHFMQSKPQAVANPDPAGCPFQSGRLCTVHTIRPFGCRIYYCDPTAQQWQQDLYEQMHRELKELHETFEISYFYIEWREALEAAMQPVT